MITPKINPLRMLTWYQHFMDAQKQPSRGVLCSENMQQIYRRTPMPKCDFNKVAKQLWNPQFGKGVFLQICFIFQEYLFQRALLASCFWMFLILQYLTKILRPILFPPLSMLFTGIWDIVLAQASALLLLQYAATLGRGKGPNLFL